MTHFLTTGSKIYLSQLILKRGWVAAERQQNNVSIDIGAAIWIGYVGQPDILVPLHI